MIKSSFRRKQSVLGFCSLSSTRQTNKRRLTITLVHVLFTFIGNTESVNDAKYIRYPKTLTKKEFWTPDKLCMRFSHTTISG